MTEGCATPLRGDLAGVGCQAAWLESGSWMRPVVTMLAAAVEKSTRPTLRIVVELAVCPCQYCTGWSIRHVGFGTVFSRKWSSTGSREPPQYCMPNEMLSSDSAVVSSGVTSFHPSTLPLRRSSEALRACSVSMASPTSFRCNAAVVMERRWLQARWCSAESRLGCTLV